MGVKALRSHSQSKRHQKLVKENEQIANLKKKKGETASKKGIKPKVRGYSLTIRFEKFQLFSYAKYYSFNTSRRRED